MLSQLNCLSRDVEGRYATDAELLFIAEYVKSYLRRLQTYQKLQEIEVTIVQQTHAKMQLIDPKLFYYGAEDVTSKWKQDTLRTLRYSAVAMLFNDLETLQEQFSSWPQIMRAFGAQQSCRVTYQLMQEVFKRQLSAQQADRLCPILELARQSLGSVN